MTYQLGEGGNHRSFHTQILTVYLSSFCLKGNASYLTFTVAFSAVIDGGCYIHRWDFHSYIFAYCSLVEVLLRHVNVQGDAVFAEV